MGPCSGKGGRWGAIALSLAVSGVGAVASVPARAAELDVVRSESCLRRGITRVLELREGPEGGLPCEVVYLKPDEDGSERVMWLARHERAFCTTHFESFVVKLETKLAWDCEPDAPNEEEGVATDAPAVAQRTGSPDETAPPPPTDGNGTLPARAPDPLPRLEAAGGAESGARDTPADRAITPSLAGARPAPVSGSAKERMAALRELIPSGPYTLLPEAGEGEGRGTDGCPPGGSFFWNTRDPDRPVFEIGRSLELPVLLPAEVDETLVLNAEPPAENAALVLGEGGFVPDSLALERVRSDRRGRTITIRVVPDEDDGEGRARLCRYALGG